MGNVPLSTPNAKTTLGLTAQVVCGKTVTQENYTGKLDVSILNRGGGDKHQSQLISQCHQHHLTLEVKVGIH